MTNSKWNERFDILNRSRDDGCFTLELYIGIEKVETLTIKNSGFFFYINALHTDVPNKITLFYFNRNKNTFELNKWIFSERLFYMEYSEGFIYSEMEDLAHIFRSAQETDIETAKKTVNDGFKYAYNNINKIFNNLNSL